MLNVASQIVFNFCQYYLSFPQVESDLDAIKNATISVTPLLTDLTAAGYINPLSEWLGEMD